MQQEKYDIFISYRRDGGNDKAQILKLYLENNGFRDRVFMDVHKLTYGAFGNHIKEAIESAPVFLVLLTPNALDRCVDEDDWVRKEIEYAVEKRKCIIPINPNGSFAGLPDGMKLPETINMVLDIHNYATVDFVQLKSSMNDLIERWITPAIKAEEARLERERKVRLEAEEEARQAAREAYLLSLPDVEFTPYKTKGKFGYKIKSTCENAISCEYDRATLFGYGLAAVKKDGKWGYIDKSGKVVIDIKYDKANSVVNGVVEVKLHDQTLYFDVKGNELSQEHIINNNIFPSWKTRFIKNEKVIIIGLGVIALIVCCYSFIPFMKSNQWVNSGGVGLIIKRKYNLSGTYDRYALFTKDGYKFTRYKYTYFENTFTEGYTIVGVNGKYGFIDVTGKEVTPLKYDNVVSFREGMALVRLAGEWGFIDKTGKEVVPLKYDKAESFNNGIARVKFNGKWGFIDITGKEIIPLEYGILGEMHDGIIKVNRLNNEAYPVDVTSFIRGKWGFITKDGKKITDCIYDYVDDFKEGYARVKINDKWGYINTNGDVVIAIKYDNAWDFNEGLANVAIGNKCGYINNRDSVVIPIVYDYVWGLHNGINSLEYNGYEITLLGWDNQFDFINGVALVSLDGKWGYINNKGVKITDIKYDDAYAFSEGLGRVNIGGEKKMKVNGRATNGRFGFVDASGKEVIPIKYDSAFCFKNGVAKVKLNDEWFYIDKSGNRK